MLRSIIGLTLAGAFVAVGLVPAVAQSAPPGSYLQTCSDVRVNGSRLEARCTNSAGALISSRLDLDSCQNADIANVEGSLRCVSPGLPTGTYQQSCDGIAMQGQMLYAACRNVSGVPQRTSLDLNTCRGGTVSNDNGNLRCMANLDTGNSSDLPDGPFLQSCSGSYMQGSILYANCRAANGATVRASLDVDLCRGNDVAKDNGSLQCMTNLDSPGPLNAPAGPYQQSCNGAVMQGSTLNAYCRTQSGTTVRSSIDVSQCNDTVNANIDGNLRCIQSRANGPNNGPAIASMPGGSYQQTCNNTSFQGSTLSATCSTPNGQPVTSSLDLNSCQANSDVVNSGGRLECRYYR